MGDVPVEIAEIAVPQLDVPHGPAAPKQLARAKTTQPGRAPDLHQLRSHPDVPERRAGLDVECQDVTGSQFEQAQHLQAPAHL